MEIFSEKLALHIPHVAYVDGAYEPVDFEKLKRLLSAALSTAGFGSWHSIPAEGCYKGRRYAEELFTVFVKAEADAETVSKIFEEAFSYGNDFMRQEAFAYERNGKLIVETLL